MTGQKGPGESGDQRMDFREMTYITTIADCGSITAAARKLYISQPSLSYIVSKVEQETGAKLFERKNYPLTLTYAGEKYVETARKILSLNDNMRRELMDITGGEKGMISFGIPTERAGYMLPKVLKQFRAKYPGIEVRLNEAKSDELMEQLLRDEIRFYIIPRSRADLPAGLRTEVIYRERLLLVTGPDTVTPDMLKDGAEDEVSLGRLKDEAFILLKRGHALRRKTDDVMKRHKIEPARIMEVSSCISAVQLADAGLGVTIVPQRAVEVLGGAERFSCYRYAADPDSWNVNVIYKEDTYLDRTERYFIDLLKQAFGNAESRETGEKTETENETGPDA